MGVSKVVYGDQSLIDLTSDTVSESTLASGATAHGADGELITGTATFGFMGFSLSDEGHLLLHYSGDAPPDFELRSDGHLYFTV